MQKISLTCKRTYTPKLRASTFKHKNERRNNRQQQKQQVQPREPASDDEKPFFDTPDIELSTFPAEDNPCGLDKSRGPRRRYGGLLVATLPCGRVVGLRRITTDRYGRTVGELFIDGSNVQQRMVASGHAEIYWKYAHQCPWTR